MATKLARKTLPAGLSPEDFKYMGRPATEQGDFGDDVGIADMACVNQFGANNDKFYHAGVVQAGAKWFVYLEWGRRKPGKSWNGSFRGQDFQFVECASEPEARSWFKKQAVSKNTKRLEQKKIEGKTIWAGKSGKDGYLVQKLATRETGLPDAYTIKDSSGVQVQAKKKPAKKAAKVTKKYEPQVISLTKALLGGTQEFARAAQQATGVIPTMEAIEEVREDYIPAALSRISKIGNDTAKQLKDKKLQDISKLVATIVPRPIPRSGDPGAIILSTENIFQVQQDLDAFEAALKNEDFEVETKDDATDCDKLLNAQIGWIDPKSPEGKWLANTFHGMSNNRHGHLRGKATIKNMFTVVRPDRDDAFTAAVKKVAKKRKGETEIVRAGLQPKTRNDVSDIADYYDAANVFLGIHGTRAVNVAPIMQGNLRLPKALKGVHITGSAFGHGIYFATDWKKSWGYTGYSDSYYGSGGSIKGRGAFMFLTDTIAGKPYMTKRTMWDTVNCPRGYDSVYAQRGRTSVQNDEHVIFDPNYQRIHYLIELTR